MLTAAAVAAIPMGLRSAPLYQSRTLTRKYAKFGDGSSAPTPAHPVTAHRGFQLQLYRAAVAAAERKTLGDASRGLGSNNYDAFPRSEE